jgi:hypothetical protein
MMGALKMEWRIGKKMCGWVSLHHFFVDDDLMVAWEFELLLQKEDETLEHYGNELVFLLGFFFFI